MNSRRSIQTGRILLLASLGVGLQVYPACAQVVEVEHCRAAEFELSSGVLPSQSEASNAANLLMQAGRPHAAIFELQPALDRHPDHDLTRFSVNVLLAEAYRIAGKDKLAAQTLERLLFERPNSAELRFRLAKVYGSLGSFEDSAKQYHGSITSQPRTLHGFTGIGENSASDGESF